MSVTTATDTPSRPLSRSSRAVLDRAREYVASDPRRAFQTALGLLWLLDGALQFQSFTYSKGFIRTLTSNASGQPYWLASSIRWAADLAQQNLTIGNTLFGLTQVTIGLGLLHRRTVKPALALSFAWSLGVWWFGEAFGMLFTNAANPLTGAPGAVLLYAIVGLLVWPGERPGGLLGVRRARAVWTVLWLVMAWLWLLDANSGANATSSAIDAAPAGISWLSGLQHGAATATRGNGLLIAVVLAFLSAAIGIAGAINWRPKLFVGATIILNLAYWVFGQGLGGVFTGTATDPNAAPLFILLGLALYSLTRVENASLTSRVEQTDLRTPGSPA
jgi:hypothetical protein